MSKNLKRNSACSNKQAQFAKKINVHTLKLPPKGENVNVEKTISQVNNLLLSCKEKINELKLPDFGSGLCDSGVFSLNYSREVTIASLVADRFTNKFEQPSTSAEQLLRDACTRDWLAFESHHLREYSRGPKQNTWVGDRITLFEAASLIKDWLEPECYTKSFWHFVSDAPINFGPGETFFSLSGAVSIHEKLKPENWSVTSDACPMACMVIASHKGLRRQIVNWFKTNQTPAEYDVNQKRAYVACKDNKSSRLPLKVSVLAHRIFHEFFYANGKASDLIIMGSRASSVYKNSKKRRPINIEGLLNIILQKIVGWGLRQCLKVNAGVNLDEDQDKHKRMLTNMALTTGDFSNASESITVWLTRNLLRRCPKIYQILETFRSTFCLHNYPHITENGRIDRQPEWFPNEKFSSMGNGFTFELLTITILSIARVYDRNASVYGDDLICSTVSAKDIFNVLEQVGFVLNMKKTFYNAPLRESCGGFYLHEYGYITSFDFKWCKSIPDVITVINKLRRVIELNENWDHPLRDLLSQTRAEILRLNLSPTWFGPVVNSQQLPLWIEDRNYFRRHKGSNEAMRNWRKFEKSAEILSERWQYFRNDCITNAFSHQDWCVVQIYEKVEQVRHLIQDVVHPIKDAHILGAYLHAGMRTEGLDRQKENEVRYVKRFLLVTPHGDSIVIDDRVHAEILERGL